MVLGNTYHKFCLDREVVADEIIPSNRPVGEQGSSVSIVSGYGLDDPWIQVRSPAGAKEFFL
jgi:hypothetical protein